MYIVSGSRPVGHIINGAANDFPSESGNGVSMISSVDSRSFFYWNNDQGRRKRGWEWEQQTSQILVTSKNLVFTLLPPPLLDFQTIRRLWIMVGGQQILILR